MTCTPSGVRPGTTRPTRRLWRASRPDSTCETTAVSGRTTTRVHRVPQPTEQTQPQAKTYRLAVVPGDGIGREVPAEAVKVLDEAAPTAGVTFEPTRYDLGAERYLATGEVLPDAVLAEIREHDAILLGAVGGRPGDPKLPPGVLERGSAAQAALRARPLRQPPPLAHLPGRDIASPPRRLGPRRGGLRGRSRRHGG